MKIDRKSWHYRLWAAGRIGGSPTNLCKYFWHIALVKVALPLVIVGLAIASLVAIVIAFVRDPWSSIAVTASILLGIAVVVGLFVWKDRRDERRDLERTGVMAPREPSVLSSYLSARKKKICPLIEVVDE